MEQYRYTDSDTATTYSQVDGSSPGSPCASTGCDEDSLHSVGDSAASMELDSSKLNRCASSQYSVESTLDGATVLLTGATGYVGKLVLEQLLRTCPGTKKVYVTIRSSKDKHGNEVCPQQRLKKMLSGPEFQMLQKQMDDLLKRVEVIPADLATRGLGLSPHDRARLCRDTNFIIHCAASIRFDEPISTIMRTNYACTQQLLELATTMPSLRCFTYMSTAYVNSNLPRHSQIREEIYPLPGTKDPIAVAQELLDLAPKKADKKVSKAGSVYAQAAKLMKQWKLQNTYFVAKNLSERLVMSYDRKPFPVCIMRPSLIGCVAGNPFPGFIGNTSGFTALILGTLAGIIRFVQHNPQHRIAVVPGDIVSSATLAATAATAVAPGMMSNIVHVCSSESYPLANIAVYLAIGSLVMQDPVSDPSKTLVQDGQYWVDWVRHRSVFNLKCAARRVKLVAVGALLRMQGKRRMAKKILMAHNIWSSLGSSEHDYDFTFQTVTTQVLYDLLSSTERQTIKTVWREDLGDSWIRYLRTYTAGVRHIYMKEPSPLTDQQDYRPRN